MAKPELLRLHADDVLFFQEVRAAMFRVAAEYKLRLLSVEPMPNPKVGIDRLGDCNSHGEIRLVMRYRHEDGTWTEPRHPEEVWSTAAHELAHLRHLNHSTQFTEFMFEMRQALTNQRAEKEDHKAKLITKLVKLQRQREGEAALGNTAAAEAFAGMINKLLIENELNPTDLDYARASDNDPVIELRVDLNRWGIERVERRVAWQEQLARVVAKAHLCEFLLRTGSNDRWFVGTRSHAEVAEYCYGVLVPAAQAMAYAAREQHRRQLRKEHGIKPGHSLRGVPQATGYTESWLKAFVDRIGERFDAERRAAVEAADMAQKLTTHPAPGAQSTAMVRLNGAMRKVQSYVDAKYAKPSKRAKLINSRGSYNAAGRRDGKAAADSMAIGRKGIKSGVKGLLGS